MSVSLHQIIYHLCLPPKLPQENDYSPELDIFLVRQISAALQSYCDLASEANVQLWSSVIKMLDQMQYLRSEHGEILSESLMNAMKMMSSGGT